MTDKVLVLTTAGNDAEAQKIARELVERKLAACVSIVPRVQSIYRWQGKVESAEEYLMVVKTSSARIESVEAAIRELHSYEVPEFVVISIEDGSEKYLNWIAESVQ